MATLANIESPVWAMSIYGYGVVVEGLAAIRQRMDLAIRTTRGTDPLRPEFGSLVYKFIDAPINIAIPNVKKELVDALSLWVPDIRVISIRHSIPVPGNIVFEILYKILDETIIDRLVFDLRGNLSVPDTYNEIVLQSGFPDNPHNYRYQFILKKNEAHVNPLPAPEGYASIQEMFDWMKTNMHYLGRWYMLTDKIALYMSSEGVVSASLELKVVPIIRFSADFPHLLPGEFYSVEFLANGNSAVPEMPKTFVTPGEVLGWVQSNWGDYATWQIEYLLIGGDSVFSDDFSDEFEINASGYRLVGISNIETFTGNLEITKV